MKTILIHIFAFILFCFIIASILSCTGGDTSTQPDTSAFSEGSPVTINIDNSSHDTLIEPDCSRK